VHELGHYVTAHLFRFPEIRVPESLSLGGKPAGAMSWKIGSSGLVGPDGYRLPSERWGAIGLFRNLDEAQASLETKESYLPFLPEVVESWHLLLLPVMHRGECNHLSRENPGLCLEIAPNDPGGQLVVITTAGFVLGPSLDLERVIDFRRKVDALLGFMRSSDGNLASTVFTPHTAGDDGCTLTVWRSDAAMLSAAYRPAEHRTQVDRYKKEKTADRTSFTRLRILKTCGQWNGADPLRQSEQP